ncbi:MAG TPA: hypothetical protein IAB51_05430 [Candidatus Merdivicinus excrementipullorum]|uniref:Anti-sigma factor RsgI-like middle domain-containing protein n=1 Tax=Candidatus Merdivicinus excrementipullorum TaxID=2840867 RepID=A0A9D1K0N4_9FIRM|nr:hypothetical protein [Candidatus Merdivicinus excrementipullorum]
MRYLVMECHPGYAVLLDEEGRFLKAANLQYQIGQTVYDPVLMKETPEKRRVMPWISGGIAAIAACFLLFFGVNYYQNYLQPYSSIYLAINPEVQMDLNRQGTVVELTGTNEDGDALLEGYNGKGKDKVTVADELIDRAIEMGFLSEGGQVSFSIDSPDEALFQEYGMELRAGVTEHLAGQIAVNLEIVNRKNGQGQENPENSSSPSTSQPPAESTFLPEPSQPETAPPASSSPADYDDTDYGPNNDGVTDYTPSASSAPPADTDYGPGSDGVTDYDDTDYGPNNDGVTDYTQPASSAPPADTNYSSGSNGVTDYTDGTTDYDPDNDDDSDDDSNYDDGDDDDDD